MVHGHKQPYNLSHPGQHKQKASHIHHHVHHKAGQGSKIKIAWKALLSLALVIFMAVLFFYFITQPKKLSAHVIREQALNIPAQDQKREKELDALINSIEKQDKFDLEENLLEPAKN